MSGLYKLIANFLVAEEGEEFKVYLDSEGIPTIGVGRNLRDKGISEDESRLLLKNDIIECYRDLYDIFPNFDSFSSNRRVVLISMRFNLGLSGFKGFKEMIAAIQSDDWERAAVELLDSDRGRKLIERSKREAEMLRGG